MMNVSPEDAARVMGNVEKMLETMNQCEFKSSYEQMIVLHALQDAVLTGLGEMLERSEDETEACVEAAEVADEHQRQAEEVGGL